ncbi:MAG: O-methyltransferase [Melioribacteraceae bacterium]|nr:O-methyltransferase [Melioribacteraceae bacterium]
MAIILDTTQIDYIRQFNKVEDPLILEMRNYAIHRKIPILEDISVELIKTFIKIKKPSRVLELGTAIAFTTIQIAEVLPENSLIDTIEKSKDNLTIAKSYIERSGFQNKINLIEGDASEIIPNLSNKYDLIFLDADKEAYEQLFDQSIELLNDDGIYIVDNLLWKGFPASQTVPKEYEISTKHIRKFNSYFFSSDKLVSTLFPVGDGLGVGIKK